MTKAFRHTGVLMMLGVVALGLLGAAYTLWYENLEVDVTVATGTFDADWSCEEFQTWTPNEAGEGEPRTINNDTDCAGADRPTYAIVPASGPLVWYNPTSTGWIASKATTCDSSITTDSGAGGNDDEDNNQLNLSLSNLYPYSGCEFSIDLHNDGSTPLHLAVNNVVVTGPLAPFIRWDVLPGSSPTCLPLIEAIFAWNGDPDPLVVGGANPVQLHFSDEILCNVRIWITETIQTPNGPVTVPENASTTISAVVTAHQWNEPANP